MGLDFAIDELYASGWSTLDTSGCARHSDGRAYPSVNKITEEFRSVGYSLTVRHIQLFDCYRAEWRDETAQAQGAVVGQSAEEAAVYALSHLRRRSAVTA
jgi:hypothetical protein